MLARVLVCFLVTLALGQQIVLAKTFKFKFDNVTQCEPVSISFRGSEVPADSIPVTLTLIPLSAPPIMIEIPNAAVNSSGVYVTFFPLKAGTQFMASLDDDTGYNSARISDIFRVLDSGDDTCVPTPSPSPDPLFTVSETMEQCSNFTVVYNTTSAPSIRLFQPRGKSFRLTQQSDDMESKTATYLMDFPRQRDVVLLLDSGDSERNSTDLLHIDGDANTSQECLKDWGNYNTDNDDAGDGENNQTAAVVSSNGTVIGVSVGGGIVLVVCIVVVLWILRERRRRAAVTNSFQPYSNPSEKRPSFDSSDKVLNIKALPPIPPPTVESDFVENPPYALAKYSPTESNFSVSSFDHKPPSSPPERRFTSMSRRSGTPMDIEDMLDIAATHARRSFTPSASSPRSPHSPPAPLKEVYLRPEADVPHGPNSPALSSIFYLSGIAPSTPRARLSHASSASEIDVNIIPPRPSIGGDSGIGGFPRTPGRDSRDSASSWGTNEEVKRS